jgi:serine-aspartate repeat-containing protein C/D/E
MITEGGVGSYKVELDTVSDKDRTFTITIANGTANRIDANKGTRLGNATQPAFTGNPDSTLENQQVAKDFAKWGDIYWKTINTEPNGYQVRDDKDFTVSKSDGSLNTGNTITVTVKAGQQTSDAFKVDAWKENVISPWALLPTQLNANESLYRFYDQENRYIGTGLTSPEASKQREGDETFSVTLTSATDANIHAADSKIDVTIKDASKINYISPIALDLNDDGIQTVSVDAGVKFDILNSGTAVQTGWISGEDGFLAIDRNGNGSIDDRSELFGGAVGEGFGTLASFDSNKDGVVDATDEFFTSLGVWRDANVDGVTDAGEFTSLADAGIAKLNTAYISNFSTDAQGNVLGEKSNAITSNGNSIDTVDVYFKLG